MRLTMRTSDGEAYWSDTKGGGWRSSSIHSRAALKKLAAYEDAEEQGRLVILPCKVGDTLYAPTRNIISEFRVEVFEYGGYSESFLRIGWRLTKGITGNFRLDGIRASEIGKTVFMSREAAEAALKGGQDDGTA